MADQVITFRVRVGPARTLTSATSVALSNPAGTAGVVRDDTGAVVVADGTPMVETSTGVYQYTLPNVVAGVTYRYWIECLLNGATYRREETTRVDPAALLPSYLTLARFDALAASLPDLPASVLAETAARKTAAIGLASSRIDTMRFQGRKLDDAQALAFPRRYQDSVTTVDGWTTLTSGVIAAVPRKVELATCYEVAAVFDVEAQRLRQARAAGLTSQSTGPLSESYASLKDVPIHELSDRARAMLAPFKLRTGGLL